MFGNQRLYIFRDQIKCNTEKLVEMVYLTKAQSLRQSQTGIELNIKLSSATKSACGRNFLLLYLTDIPWVPLCPYTHGWKWSYFNTFSGCQVWYIVKELVGKQRRPKKLYFRKASQVFLMQLAFYTYFEQPELDYKCLEYENDVLFIFFLCEEVFNHILRK